MRRGLPARRAFTLLELLIVLGILSGLLVLVTPAFGRLADRSRLGRVGQALARLLLEAELAASRSGAPVTVTLDPDGRALRLTAARETPARYGTSEPLRGPNTALALPAGVELRRLPWLGSAPPGAPLVIRPDRSSAGARFELAAGADTLELGLHPVTGRVRARAALRKAGP